MNYVPTFTATLRGDELRWALCQIDEPPPRTFACNHNGPSCRSCHDSVIRWVYGRLGPTVPVPVDLEAFFGERRSRAADTETAPGGRVDAERAIEDAIATWNGAYDKAEGSLASAIYENLKPFLKPSVK